MSIRRGEVIEVFMRRDGMSRAEAEDNFRTLRRQLVECVKYGIDAVERCLYDWGLELDYLY